MEEPLEDKKLRSYLQERFYNSRSELNDLEWDDIAPHISPAGSTFQLKEGGIKWLFIAASFLIAALLATYYFYNNTYDEISENKQLITENGKVPQNLSQPESELPAAEETQKETSSEIVEKGEPEASASDINRSKTEQQVTASKTSSRQEKLTKSDKEEVEARVNIEDTFLGDRLSAGGELLVVKESDIDIELPVVQSAHSHDKGSEGVYKFPGSKGGSPGLKMHNVSFSLGLVQKYSTYFPNQSDFTYISGGNSSLPLVSHNRLGIRSSVTAGFNLNEKWNMVAGVSYLYQKNYFKYKSRNLLTSQIDESEVDEVSNHFGLSAGLERNVSFLSASGFKPMLHFNVEFLKRIGSGNNTLEDILVAELGYSISLLDSKYAELRLKPVLSYSFLESKNSLYSSKPYWFGIQFSVARKVR